MTTELASRPKGVKIRDDPLPKIQNAGKIIATGGHNADMSIRQDVYGLAGPGNPGTPEHIKKFRKTNNAEPGQIMVHPGFQQDRKPVDYHKSFGKQTHFSEAVGHIVKAQNLNGLADKFNDIKEGKYASNVREPLGKSYTRDYKWPNNLADQGFGVPTITVKDQAKHVLYPYGGSMEEKAETARMYQKTHGNWGPGEQRKRDYLWDQNPRIAEGKGDVQAHPFGYGEKRLLNGAMRAVMPERYEEGFPKTVIVKKIVEDQKAVNNDMLGTVKNLGQGQTKKPEDHAFGSQVKVDPWNAAKCINGDPTERDLQPDNDLGKSLKPNCTNSVRRPQDVERSFGCPTIRVDIPYKEKRSISDYQNYGDEPEAVDLLFPSTHTEIGVGENDFQQRRCRQDIKALFEKIGYSYKVGKFNAIYNKSKEICGSLDDSSSVRAFMTAVQMLHHVE